MLDELQRQLPSLSAVISSELYQNYVKRLESLITNNEPRSSNFTALKQHLFEATVTPVEAIDEEYYSTLYKRTNSKKKETQTPLELPSTSEKLGNNDMVDEMVEHHKKIQGEHIEAMVHLAQTLRKNATMGAEILKKDDKVEKVFS